MPYKSEAQRKYFNSPEGKKKIGPEEVEHWNEVSKGMKLPKKIEDAIRSCDEDKKTYVVRFIIPGEEHEESMEVKAYSKEQAIGYVKKTVKRRKLYNIRVEEK